MNPTLSPVDEARAWLAEAGPQTVSMRCDVTVVANLLAELATAREMYTAARLRAKEVREQAKVDRDAHDREMVAVADAIGAAPTLDDMLDHGAELRSEASGAFKHRMASHNLRAQLAQRDSAIREVRDAHHPVEVWQYDDVNGVWVTDADGEKIVLERWCAACSSDDALAAIGDCEWDEGMSGGVLYPCDTVRILDRSAS